MGVSFFVALSFLTGSLLAMGPGLTNAVNPVADQIFYVVLRVMVIFGFSFALVRRHHRNIYHALSYTGLLIFIDQVVIKNAWYAFEFHRHPDVWKDMSLTVVIYSNSFSYIVFLPLILMIALLGAGAGFYLNRRSSRATRAT